MVHRIARGLDIPLAGAPRQQIDTGPPAFRVALLGGDYPGLRPVLRVAEGDRIRRGQPVFADRHRPDIVFTAPAAGKVTAINRGLRRRLESVVIAREGDDAVDPPRGLPTAPDKLGPQQVRTALLASGLWTGIRARPFGGVADPGAEPAAIFVTAMDSNPLAADMDIILAAGAEDFQTGLAAAARMAECPVYVCAGPDTDLPAMEMARVSVARFAGPHPSGLPGTHIHLLHPPPPGKAVWQIGCQDVIAMGRLFTKGEAESERVVALGGPAMSRPRLVRAPLGASTEDLLAGEITGGPVRIVSGSPLSGHRAVGPHAFLGRHHSQLCALPEQAHGDGRSVYGMWPGLSRKARMTTAGHGRPTGFLPVEMFERVTPLDIPVAVLLRALLGGDTELAAALGCRALVEEDLALCGHVCPGKQDYGTALRAALHELEAGT